MLKAPALIEHSFPLKFTHVLLSQSSAPYKVALNIKISRKDTSGESPAFFI